MKSISVIIPAYRVQEKINRCIESFQKQSFTDFEAIVVDDGTPDNTSQIVDEFALLDDRFIVVHKKNTGVSASRNIALQLTMGESIVFSDSDDYVSNDYLASLKKIVQGKKNFIGICNYYLVKGKEKSLCDHNLGDNRYYGFNEIRGQIYDNIFLNRNTTGYYSLCNKIISREMIVRNKIMLEESMTFGEDMVFFLRCLSKAEWFCSSSVPAYYYEQTDDGLFNRYRRSLVNDIVKCYSEIVRVTDNGKRKDIDWIPLSEKYTYFIDLYSKNVISTEDKWVDILTSAYRNTVIKDIYSRFIYIESLPEEDPIRQKYQKNEFRLPRLIGNGKTLLAIVLADYQFNPNNAVRIIRREINNAIRKL